MMKTTENRKVELAAERQTLTAVKILRSIIKGDPLSPLLFVITMMLIMH